MTPLASIPALRDLPPAALEALARDSRARRLPARTVLRPEGGPARDAVLLLSGTLVASYHASTGVEVWASRWEGPTIADKPAVLHGRASVTGLVSRTECELLLLTRARFLRLLAEQESVRTTVLNRLAEDVMVTRQRLVQAAAMPAVARVAAWLGSTPGVVAWRGSQEELAHLLGLSRVTVNRALARLVRCGAVGVTPRGVVIVDRARLDDAARG